MGAPSICSLTTWTQQAISAGSTAKGVQPEAQGTMPIAGMP